MSYGISIKLNDKFDFDIDSNTKGLILISDVENFTQSITLLLNIHEGEILFAPTYGTRLSEIVGTNNPLHYIEHLVEQALIKDPRVLYIISVDAIKVQHDITLNIAIQSSGNEIVNLRGVMIW